MIEVHLYGKLHRFTDNQDPSCDSIVYVPTEDGDTIEDIANRRTISLYKLNSNTVF